MSGPLFVDNASQMTAPGVYAIDVSPPTLIAGIPNGKIAMVGQFAWGPARTVYEPTSPADFLAKYEPDGSPRTSTGYTALLRRKGLSLAIYRVLHSDCDKAEVTAAGTGGNIYAQARYDGTLGNSIVLGIADASDGVAGHKKITATLSNATTGTTSEVLADNIAVPNGTPITLDVSTSKLIGTLTIDTAMSAWPQLTSFTLSSGSNGSAITAADYDTGMTALDLVDDVAELGSDDCGNSIRSAVNSYIYTHAVNAAGRHIGNITGNPGNTWAQVKTDVASYRSKWCSYSANWAYVLAPDGSKVLTPKWTFDASARINLRPMESNAWRAANVTAYYAGIDSIYAPQFSASDPGVQSDATNLGIGVLLRLPDGRFTSLHDRNTSLAVKDRFLVTSRIRRHLAASLIVGLSDFTNGPGTEDEGRDLIKSVVTFMGGKKAEGMVSAFAVDAKTVNTPETAAMGEFYVAIRATTPAPREKIGLLLSAGPTVQILDE